MLQSITAGHLRSIAGHAYMRGEEYWREGRVVECDDTDGSLDGVVEGAARYRVRVSVYDGRLVSACSCPVGGGMCKHAVALVLHHLGRRDALPQPEPITGAFATRAELDAWANRHHVQHALLVSAELLCAELTIQPQDYWIRTVLARLPIREVGALELAARHARARGVDVALAKAAYRVLHREAASVRDGLGEEAARPTAAPDPALAPLWDKLVGLRAGLRRTAYPRARLARTAAGTWRFEAPGILWKERVRVLRPASFSMHSVATRLSIDGTGVAQFECACGPATCTHALALVDATLDLLEDPARRDDALALADQLMRPGWARALAELDVIESRTSAPRGPLEVWWHIETEPGAVDITPVIKKATRRGISSSRIGPIKLVDEHRYDLADRDLQIAEQLGGWVPSARSTYPARAFLALAGHPRVAFGDDGEPVEIVRAPLGFTALPAGEHIRLEPSLFGARFSPKLLEALLDAFAPGEPLIVVDPDNRRVALVEVGDEARRLWAALATHGDTFPPEAHAQLLDRLGRIEGRMPVVLPAELKGKQLPGKPVVVVRMRLAGDALELELFVRAAPGTPLWSPGAGPRDVLVVKNGERGFVRRDHAGEPSHARARFTDLIDGIDPAEIEEGPPFCFSVRDPDRAIQLVAAAQDPPAGLEAEWLDARPVVRGTAAVESLRVRVERQQDWFGITGDVRVDGSRIELALLLDAVRRQQRFVRVDANRWVELSQALRERLVAVADQTYATRDRLELSPGAVPAIRALADAGAKVATAPAWDVLAERLVASRRLRPRPPATLRATLRDYQVAGHAWLTRVAAWGAGACLADDMGLGKTVQAIAVLLDRAKLGPAIVLAPTSVTLNWVDELARFAPSLRPVVYTEQTDRTAALAKLGKHDVVILSYGLLVRDADALAATKFATLVVDEAQALKNPTTQRARAARRLDADFRIALSGTPFENHLGELWSLFAVVFPGLLGSWEQFRERYAIPIERDKDPVARASLARVLQPFLLRRTKAEVARELPARTEVEVAVALSDDEAALYEDARLSALAELSASKQVRDERRRFQILAALTRLRLLACHPRLYDATQQLPSSKLARALELLEELRAEGHRALVFSQFTSHLALVREALDAAGFRYLYLDGATPPAERKRLVDVFQTGDADVFLISLKAGGQGINLTGADYVLHLDPWWNPAVEDQATDRAHRIGQAKPVTVYRLIARGTIEERIVALHTAKRALVASVLEGTGAAARLTTKDLMALLQSR